MFVLHFSCRLRQADCVIIDEISMVSSHTLHIINRLMQFCKSNERIMGGAQQTFCGDFLQLPPIRNELSGDLAEPAILCDRFQKYVPQMHLTQVIICAVV